MQFGETVLPTVERATGQMPFDMTPFMRFLHSKLDLLRPFLKDRVEMTVALHRHPGIAGVMEAAEELLRAVPGIRIVKLDVPAVGLQSVNLVTLPKFKAELQLKELEAAKAAGVDALIAVYHSDHRELCAHERDWPFRIHQYSGGGRREHGPAPGRPLQGAEDQAGRRRDHRRHH